ncbi:MAG: hypothetical protein RLZZ450_967 [Pseudomonadota bacterium]|jgi:hypothetical protein
MANLRVVSGPSISGDRCTVTVTNGPAETTATASFFLSFGAVWAELGVGTGYVPANDTTTFYRDGAGGALTADVDLNGTP